MPQTLPSLHVMAVDWDHPAWQGDFYPLDLPADWRLTYYANEFSGVLLPQSVWVEIEPQYIEAWLDDVSSDFRFYLAVEDAVGGELCHEKGQVFGDALGGFVVPSDELMPALEGLPVLRQANLYTSEDLLPENTAVIIEDSELGDLKSQREQLQVLVRRLPANAEVPVFIQGSPPSIELLRNLQQLAQLMGFA